MACVVVFGTFDLLHPGHIKLLETAAKLGRVQVVLTTDALVAKYKPRAGVHNFQVRAQRLSRLAMIEHVTPCDLHAGEFETLKHLKPDYIVLGYDQKELRKALCSHYAGRLMSPKMIITKPYRPQLYKSTIIRNAWE